MPNYCNYTLKVKGDIENCKKFKAKLEDYNEPNHFFRIFESDVCDKGSDYLIISGYCAWSIESCCRESGYSGGVDLFAVNTADLNLDLEVWSREEDGCFFEEHYIYHKGKCDADECVNIEPYPPYWDKEEFPIFNDYIGEMGLENCNLKEEDFDEYGNYMGDWDTGGFEGWGEFSI